MFHFFKGHHRHHPHMHGHGHHRGGGGRGPKMFDSGAMRYVVLQLIAEKPRHGYDVIKELEQRAGGGYTPSPGAIYPLLSMLYDMGHVSISQEGNKKLHTVTPEGQAFLDENRQMVDAMMARVGEPAEGAGDLRALMHALKEAVIGRARDATASEERLRRIRAILSKAAADINQLQ
ncbi:PadR family transcriptional regulator [Pseudoduganella namucuonensis]|uniref:DNA-binding transcriptional regulator, PadR family n=1 Tax=Pseudoduganella namucuonensis TaxID=1035707 RepID=A0A1I7FI89_9BURK|nr:PadR family transcriptional regulator [Pseudoduganella namucuonensis]SFU35913.1 DNA-binding transcriptional regulator, PadR family [Pseudoduganella namucuonensis]